MAAKFSEMALSFIQALRRRLAPKPAAEAEPVITIHEDDWGMRNLHPLAGLAQVEADMAASDAASEANFDGVGWSDMHAIRPPAATFADEGLTLAAAAAALAGFMPRVMQFNASMYGLMNKDSDPYGSYETDAWCFGFDRDCFVKIEPSGDLVGSIWFEAATGDEEQLNILFKALEAIHALAPCCIADYWAHAAGSVGDDDFLDRYFEFLARNDEPV